MIALSLSSSDLLSPVWPFPGQSSALQRVFGFNSPVLGNGPSPFNPLHHPALATASAGNELALSNGSATSPSAASTPNILTPQPPNGATPLNPLTSNVLPNLNGLNADWPITKQADIAALQAAAAAAVANFSWRPGKTDWTFLLRTLNTNQDTYVQQPNFTEKIFPNEKPQNSCRSFRRVTQKAAGIEQVSSDPKEFRYIVS